MASSTLHGPPLPRARSDAQRPRTAFVFSGGASLGALQVGMLEALYERSVVPDILVGTSGGALNAAFVASRAQTLARALGSVWRSLQRDDIFPVSLSALVGGLCGRRDHLIPDRGLRRLVRRYIEFDDLADSPIPLHLVAFDLAEGREVLLSHGPAVESVLAAASIPGVFPSIAIGDRLLIDGGVVNNTPISHAVALSAERIYVLPTEDPGYRRAHDPSQSALDAAIRGVRLLVDNRLQADLVRYAPDADLIMPTFVGIVPAETTVTPAAIANDSAATTGGVNARAASAKKAPAKPSAML
jgi:NTE family protein